MIVQVLTRSVSFRIFIQSAFEQDEACHLQFDSSLVVPDQGDKRIFLLHLSSVAVDGIAWLKRHATQKRVKVAVCVDRPDIAEMLDCVHLGANAYCNSHMQTVHYQQMLRMLDKGQSWFAPDLLQQTFDIARSALVGKDLGTLLQELTAREKEIAIAVSKGKSNRQIAEEMDISEPTVKTHLTRIFKKLDLNDRLSLALMLS